MNQPLTNGSQVCIIGGGPAGSFAALHLLKLARERNLDLQVRIFEPRDFSRPGPAGCNRCAGILSSRLVRGLQALALQLPEEVIQSGLRAYAVHLDGETIRIEQPDPGRSILSVYRGGGPRLLQGAPAASFDAFLLAQACARGAEHIPERVRQVARADRPVVETAGGRAFPADLVVLATGVNSRPPLAPQFGYRPPRTAVMAQDEFLRPVGWPADQVQAFFRQPPGLIFGAAIPKGRYVSISLLGEGLRLDAINDFVAAHGLAAELSAASDGLCGCTPRIAVSPAASFFGDRWVAVGDAAVTRLYKDGIGSAFYTAQAAMTSAVRFGISRAAFRQGYAAICRQIAADNRYGRLLFDLWHQTLRRPVLLRAWREALRREGDLPVNRRIHVRVLWGMLTGDESYRDLFWLSLRPGALFGILRGLRYHR